MQRKNSSDSTKQKASLADFSVSEIDKSSSQSSLPIINVTDNEGITTEDLVIDHDDKEVESLNTPLTPVTPIEVPTTSEKAIQHEPIVVPEQHVMPTVHEQTLSESPPKQHVQIIEIEIETHAEPSAPDEQTISRENMPNVIRKLSIQEEADRLEEAEAIRSLAEDDQDEDLDELTSDSFVPGYVAPGEYSSLTF